MVRRLSKQEREEEIDAICRERSGRRKSPFKNGETKMEFLCFRCNQDFWQTPAKVAALAWCPTCVPPPKTDAQRDQLLFDIARYKGGRCLERYKGKETKILFECAEGHPWTAAPGAIFRGRWCGFCSEHVYNSPKHHNNILDQICSRRGGTRMTSYVSSHEHMLFRCKEGHKWPTMPMNIKTGGTWCPDCRKKSEGECRMICETAFGFAFPTVKPHFLLYNTTRLELDGYCERLNLAIEVNGRQHYELHKFFHGNDLAVFKAQQERDEFKVNMLKAKNIDLIIVPYTEDTLAKRDACIFREVTRIYQTRFQRGVITIYD